MLYVVVLSVVMLNVVMLNVVMLNVIMLSVIMLSVIILSVIMLSVVKLNVVINLKDYLNIMLIVIMLYVVVLSVIMLSVVTPNVVAPRPNAESGKKSLNIAVKSTETILPSFLKMAPRHLTRRHSDEWQFIGTSWAMKTGKDDGLPNVAI
jgi:hypothetical protein